MNKEVVMGLKSKKHYLPKDDVSLLDTKDWSREIFSVTRDYFSPLTALTRNFVNHVQTDYLDDEETEKKHAIR